jgi:hypothetical protein
MVKKTLLSMVVVMGLLALPQSASAGCLAGFEDCILAAAQKSTFWSAWWAYCDCELDAAECLRVAVIGR